MKKAASFFALAALTLLTGCASTAVSTSATKPTKTIFNPALLVEQPGTGKLIVKRDSGFMGGGCAVQISINGKPLASLDTGESVTAYLQPAEYIVGAASGRFCGGGDAEAPLIIKSGELRTYRVSIDQGSTIRIGPTAK